MYLYAYLQLSYIIHANSCDYLLFNISVTRDESMCQKHILHYFKEASLTVLFYTLSRFQNNSQSPIRCLLCTCEHSKENGNEPSGSDFWTS
jgi:hypothetical protein